MTSRQDIHREGGQAWQRKPIAHEWAYGPAVFGRLGAMLGAIDSQRPGFGQFATWWVGEPVVMRDDRCRAPLCRPIEPTKGSKRGDA